MTTYSCSVGLQKRCSSKLGGDRQGRALLFSLSVMPVKKHVKGKFSRLRRQRQRTEAEILHT